MSHERKGIAGDWRNYFTPGVTKNFNAQYGNLLVSAGYDLLDSGMQCKSRVRVPRKRDQPVKLRGRRTENTVSVSSDRAPISPP
ncbi:hypothetical protein LMG29542_03739 [Paraburkholderia humisilvae]|uniref:Sulfotransferase n=1 Tax=Paraburkholderia humisilvae TaxID=627669 RepID=A0A6J5E4L9_9BURK|nr:hypothetical protein LMG29542_03739 [Paraburkholderia humisilvae]